MAVDVNALAAALSEAEPSGPDLSYDNARQEIEASFERSIGGGGDDEGGEIDWRATIRLITDQAEKTRDLWLPIYLMRAAALSGQFDLLIDGAELLACLMEQRWADVHPQLDELGFIGRKTPCESLTRFADFLGPLNRVPLIEHARLGRYSGSDFIRFHDEGSNADGFGMFRALMDATEAEDLRQIVDRIDALRQAIRRADTVLTENAEGDTGTNFQPTYEAIERMRRAVAANLPGETAAPDASDTEQNSVQGSAALPQGSGTQGSGGSFGGSISSRDDVVRALDAICAYYARCEPNSPVPFALRRAREWISLDFMAVLEDIAPGGLDEAIKVLRSGRTSSSDLSGAGASSESEGGWGSSSGKDGW